MPPNDDLGRAGRSWKRERKLDGARHVIRPNHRLAIAVDDAGHVRIHVAWIDRRDLQAALRQILEHALGPRVHGVLGCRVDAARRIRLSSGYRTDVDNGTFLPLEHGRKQRARDVDPRAQVHVDYTVPGFKIGDVGCGIIEDAGVVDEGIDTTKGARRRREDPSIYSLELLLMVPSS